MDKYSDELMGFVLACLFFDAVTQDEFRRWCSRALLLDGAPAFLVDLVDFDQPIAGVFKIIGHVPNWSHTDEDECALLGIAIERGFEPYDMSVTSGEALECLRQSPTVRGLFVKVFGFIDF